MKRTTAAIWVKGIAEMLAAEGLDVRALLAVGALGCEMPLADRRSRHQRLLLLRRQAGGGAALLRLPRAHRLPAQRRPAARPAAGPRLSRSSAPLPKVVIHRGTV